MEGDEIKRVDRDISERAPGRGGSHSAGAREPEMIYLFRRFACMTLAVAVFSMVVGFLTIAMALFFLIVSKGQLNGISVFFAVGGVFIVTFFTYFTSRVIAMRYRKPRWVVEADRLIYVEGEGEVFADIPFEAVFDFELIRFAGVSHIEIVLREPLDWPAFLSKRAFPVVRKIPGREWAFLLNTVRESPQVILRMLKDRLAAFQALHGL